MPLDDFQPYQDGEPVAFLYHEKSHQEKPGGAIHPPKFHVYQKDLEESPQGRDIAALKEALAEGPVTPENIIILTRAQLEQIAAEDKPFNSNVHPFTPEEATELTGRDDEYLAQIAIEDIESIDNPNIKLAIPDGTSPEITMEDLVIEIQKRTELGRDYMEETRRYLERNDFIGHLPDREVMDKLAERFSKAKDQDHITRLVNTEGKPLSEVVQDLREGNKNGLAIAKLYRESEVSVRKAKRTQ